MLPKAVEPRNPVARESRESPPEFPPDREWKGLRPQLDMLRGINLQSTQYKKGRLSHAVWALQDRGSPKTCGYDTD